LPIKWLPPRPRVENPRLTTVTAPRLFDHPGTLNKSRSDGSRKPWVFNPRSSAHDTKVPQVAERRQLFAASSSNHPPIRIPYDGLPSPSKRKPGASARHSPDHRRASNATRRILQFALENLQFAIHPTCRRSAACRASGCPPRPRVENPRLTTVTAPRLFDHPGTLKKSRSDGSRKPWVFNPRSSARDTRSPSRGATTVVCRVIKQPSPGSHPVRWASKPVEMKARCASEALPSSPPRKQRHPPHLAIRT
jgi:hypothetical protein